MAIAMAWDANFNSEQSLKSNPAPSKHTPHSDDHQSTPKHTWFDEAVDKSSPLVYTGGQKLMPSPQLAPQDHICTANARDGFACCHCDCKFINEKDVTKWPLAAYAAWKKMVDTTPGITWNPTLVEAKVLGLKFTEQNKQVMDPSLTK
jgi:hypothetical protein